MFCPKCGKQTFLEDSIKSFKCQECSFRVFMNAAAAVIAIIRNEQGEVLFTVRRKDPCVGMLDFPGGFADYEENAEEALIREVREELNLELYNIKYLLSIPNIYEFEGIIYHTLDLAFTCKVKNYGVLRVSEEITDFKFIPIEKVLIEEIGLRSAKEIARILKN